MMTVEKALARMTDIKMKIAVHCENIKADTKHLPDKYAIGRISNEIAAIERLQTIFDAYAEIVANNGE